ncbi:MAG TPA: hypothetical protein PKO06_05075, partial [Candidatus Ozemobacteraceae bacterium]|nr:hypothetical protein [Candidatus Ozemobacteraceae bacterium]
MTKTDSTPANKRSQKPPMNEGTKLIADLIPFLNLTPSSNDLAESFFASLGSSITTRREAWHQVLCDQDIVSSLDEMRSDVRILLTDPANPAVIDRVNRFMKALVPRAIPDAGKKSLTLSLIPYDRANDLFTPGQFSCDATGFFQ